MIAPRLGTLPLPVEQACREGLAFVAFGRAFCATHQSALIVSSSADRADGQATTAWRCTGEACRLEVWT